MLYVVENPSKVGDDLFCLCFVGDDVFCFVLDFWNQHQCNFFGGQFKLSNPVTFVVVKKDVKVPKSPEKNSVV